MCTLLHLGYQNKFLDTCLPEVYSDVRGTKHTWCMWLKAIQELSCVQVLKRIDRKWIFQESSSQIFSFYSTLIQLLLLKSQDSHTNTAGLPMGLALKFLIEAILVKWSNMLFFLCKRHLYKNSTFRYPVVLSTLSVFEVVFLTLR